MLYEIRNIKKFICASHYRHYGGYIARTFLSSAWGADVSTRQGFIKLIKMVIAPVIFCTVVTGIAGMESMKSVGKTGGIAILYFEVVSTIALIVGLIIVNVVKPGAGMNIDPSSLDASAIAMYTTQAEQQSVVGFFLDIIPSSVIGAFAGGNILQVLLFAVLFGFALHKMGDKGELIFTVIGDFSKVIFNIINMIMKLAPIGAFGAMAFTIGKYGLSSLVQLFLCNLYRVHFWRFRWHCEIQWL